MKVTEFVEEGMKKVHELTRIRELQKYSKIGDYEVYLLALDSNRWFVSLRYAGFLLNRKIFKKYDEAKKFYDGVIKELKERTNND